MHQRTTPTKYDSSGVKQPPPLGPDKKLSSLILCDSVVPLCYANSHTHASCTLSNRIKFVFSKQKYQVEVIFPENIIVRKWQNYCSKTINQKHLSNSMNVSKVKHIGQICMHFTPQHIPEKANPFFS